MIKTGEQFTPFDSNPFEIKINLERYMFAMQFCADKVVLDAGCGCGLGTYLYSLVAKKVFAIDYGDEAIAYAKQYPIDERKVCFIKADLEKDLLPEHDITVALEVIEHLKDPYFFLKNLKSKELVFSIPKNSLSISKFHQFDFRSVDDVKEVIEPFYHTDNYYIQNNIWIYGKAEK